MNSSAVCSELHAVCSQQDRKREKSSEYTSYFYSVTIPGTAQIRKRISIEKMFTF